MNSKITKLVCTCMTLPLGDAIHAQETLNTPNLLFVFTDQQTCKTLEAYGNTTFDMSNLNRFSKDAVVFLNTYVSCPVSTPSRGSILTGLYPNKHGAIANNVEMPEASQTLPELINGDNRYNTCYIGKCHLGNEIFEQQGFKEWVSTEDAYAEYYSDQYDRNKKSSYYNYLKSKGFPIHKYPNLELRKYASTFPIEFTKPMFMSNAACEFLERNKENPFILYVSFLEPHTPFNGPMNEHHNIDSLELNENFNCKLTKDDPYRYRMRVKKRKKEQWKKDLQHYAGLCHQVDLAFGQIMDKLKELNLDKNTIVVFTSDHGEMMGAHGLEHKSVMYEEALKVPLMIKYPSSTPIHKLVDRPVSNVDIVPTLLHLMQPNLKLSDYALHGNNLLEKIDGRNNNLTYAVSVWNPNNDDKKMPKKFEGLAADEVARYANASFRTIITSDGWKLSISDCDKNQLFNLNSDPTECCNLFYKHQFRNQVDRLYRLLRSWQKKTNDSLNLQLTIHDEIQ